MRTRSRALFLVVPALAPAWAYAQDTAPRKSVLDDTVEALALESDEVIVSAERPYVTPLDFASGRTTIGPQEIRESGVTTVAELLRRTPSVHIGEETGDSDSKPNFGVRGLAPQRASSIAMLVDGVPLAPAPYAHPGQSLFPFTLERVHAVDIYRGGYSVRYGPNNVAGVINFLTRPIPQDPMFEERVRLGSYSAVSTYTAAGGTWGDFGILVEDVHKRGDTYRENGEYRIDNQGVKASWRVTDELRVLAQYDHFDDDSRLSGGMDDIYYENGDLDESLTPEDYFDGWQDRGNVRVIWEPERDEKFELHVFGFEGLRTFVQGSPARYGDTPPATLQSNERWARVWAAQLTHASPLRALGCENTLTLGFKYQDEKFWNRPIRWDFPAPGMPRGPEELRADGNFDYHVVTFFAEHEIKPFKGFTLTPAARWEDVGIRAEERLTGVKAQQEFTEFLPAVSASYRVLPELSVFGSWQSTYRPPSYSQIDLSGKDQDIASERAETRELGLRGRFLDGAIEPEFTWFAMDFRDRFEADPQNDDVISNIGRQENRGRELLVRADLGKIDDSLDGVKAYFGWTNLRVRLRSGDLDGNKGPGAPDDKYNWGVAWSRAGFRVGVDGLHVTESFSDAENTVIPSADGIRGINPAYTLWSARAGYDTRFLDGRGKAGVELGFTNLFDEEYFDRNGNKGIVPGPPRQWFVTFFVSIDF